MSDNRSAEPRRPVLAARAHRRRSIDKLGFADRLHLSGTFGTIHRAALDEDGFSDLVTAVHVSE
jgi:hypothetical protein